MTPNQPDGFDAPEALDPATPAPWEAPGAALQVWLKTLGWSHDALAKMLGVTRPAVSQWCAGKARPNYLRAMAMETAGAPNIWDWLTSAEREQMYGWLENMAQAGAKKP